MWNSKKYQIWCKLLSTFCIHRELNGKTCQMTPHEDITSLNRVLGTKTKSIAVYVTKIPVILTTVLLWPYMRLKTSAATSTKFPSLYNEVHVFSYYSVLRISCHTRNSWKAFLLYGYGDGQQGKSDWRHYTHIRYRGKLSSHYLTWDHLALPAKT